MPICILESIYRQCLQLGLNPDDAHDCVTEVCLRYHKRTGAFPHDEATPNTRLLRLLTLNVVREHQRAQQRRQRLEQDYLALQRQQQASAPTPMAQAIARVDCERFRAQLPDYLRRTLERMQAGDTPKAIAAQLGVTVGTVYSYQRELRERFVAFFGYDPRKSGVRVVNYSGCSSVDARDDTQKVQNDATAEDAWCSSVVVSGSEPGGVARHPDRSGSDDWGGGAAMAPAMSSGCGCKQTMTEISPQAVKRALGRPEGSSPYQVMDDGRHHPQSVHIDEPAPSPPPSPKPPYDCSDCSQNPNDWSEYDANSYCKLVANRDCDGTRGRKNGYLYQWRIRVYRNCPGGEGNSYYRCIGPKRTGKCCETSNTSDKPCEPPENDPGAPNNRLIPCNERAPQPTA